MQKGLVVYEPNKHVREGFFCLWKYMLQDLVKSRELGYRLFLRDFAAKYRQSLLGVFWVILIPLFTVGIFAAMNRSGILSIRDTEVPYPVFALFGLTVWSLFTGLTSSISGIVGLTGGLITKINFPRIALVQSPVLTSLVDFLIRLLLLFFFLFIGGIFPHPLALFLPLSLLPILLLSIGLGLFLSIIGAVFKDLSNFVNLFLTTAMFMTPVLYPFPESGLLKTVNVYNPLYYLVEVPRAIFFRGQFTHGVEFSICTLLSVVIFLAGWRFYQVAMDRIVEKV